MYWSGDLAYRDEAGFVYYAGRTADWLRVDGENLAAAPIERILLRHPVDRRGGGVRRARPVLGRPARGGARARRRRSTPPSFEAFLDAQPDLGPKQWPRYVRVLDSLPRTATNKVLKRELAGGRPRRGRRVGARGARHVVPWPSIVRDETRSRLHGGLLRRGARHERRPGALADHGLGASRRRRRRARRARRLCSSCCGLVAVIACFARFVTEGVGTPAPVAPTESLVVGGLYRFVRNPMYLAVASMIGGQALRFRSPGAASWMLGLLWRASGASCAATSSPSLARAARRLLRALPRRGAGLVAAAASLPGVSPGQVSSRSVPRRRAAPWRPPSPAP